MVSVDPSTLRAEEISHAIVSDAHFLLMTIQPILFTACLTSMGLILSAACPVSSGLTVLAACLILSAACLISSGLIQLPACLILLGPILLATCLILTSLLVPARQSLDGRSLPRTLADGLACDCRLT